MMNTWLYRGPFLWLQQRNLFWIINVIYIYVYCMVFGKIRSLESDRKAKGTSAVWLVHQATGKKKGRKEDLYLKYSFPQGRGGTVQLCLSYGAASCVGPTIALDCYPISKSTVLVILGTLPTFNGSLSIPGSNLPLHPAPRAFTPIVLKFCQV